jgi:hypothetical protein
MSGKEISERDASTIAGSNKLDLEIFLSLNK